MAEKGVARAKDIAKHLNVSPFSVTGALRALADRELINYTSYDVVTLTSMGEAVAKDVVHRDEVLRDFLVKVLLVEETEADSAACQMEHSILKTVLDRFIRFAEFLETCPSGGANWMSGFGYHCETGGIQEDCEKCVSWSLKDLRRRAKRGGGETNRPRLIELQSGQKGRVLRIKARGAVLKRILEMGIEPGALIEVEGIAPEGDVIQVKVRGHHLSLKKHEAQGIEIEVMEPAFCASTETKKHVVEDASKGSAGAKT